MRALPRFAPPAALVLALALTAAPVHAATITIVNNDAGGEGFNDPTPVAPVGGNPGVTVGQQRLNVFQHAADIWGSILPSNIEIRVNSQFNPLSCTATSGVLGSAGPVQVFANFAGAPFAGTWYHVALANKLANADLSASNDITANFNSSVGTPGCLETSSWYYGFDGLEPAGSIELLPVVLHELGHGLGFSTTTSGTSGSYASGLPHVYDHFLLDLVGGDHWSDAGSTAGERVASAVSCNRLVWDGPNVNAHVASTLGPKPLMRVNAPGGIAGDYDVGAANFGPPLDASGVTGDVVLVNDGAGTTTDACEPIVNAVGGRIALIDRGTCPFVQKVANAQAAGAIGVIIADNVAGCPPGGLGGTDPSITIPSVRITLADGNLLKANLAGLNVTLITDPAQDAGAQNGFTKMYAPSTFAGGSSVSHWDTSAEPNLLMEPAITSSISSSVDLTLQHFADIGWFQGLLAVGDQPGRGGALQANYPNPFGRTPTTIEFSLEREQAVEVGVYDLTGRLVNTLVRERRAPGSYRVTWDGTDAAGRRLPAGIYVCRLKTGDGAHQSRHMALFR